ncbi:MAG: BON domain-containing protein [Acidobacteria bacterium]|nr:BON domain-containing protein [Acidobacteriota bacterium]MDA1235531.1 BON domain-containing protein [Acidobacteriota bacterium]
MTRFARRRFLILGFAVVSSAFAADEPLSDDQLFDQVNRRLVTDPQLGARPLQITVKNGKVTVTGFVENLKLQKRVDKVVKKVKGVREVDNRVQIRQ